MTDYNDIDEVTPRPRRTFFVTALLPILTLALGIGLGIAVADPATEAPEAVVAAPIDLADACAPRVHQAAVALTDAREKVDGLTAQVDAKRAEIQTLEQEIAKGKKASSDQAHRLAAAKSALLDLRRQLASAETDNLNLNANVNLLARNLTVARTDLAFQEVATARAETSAVDASWSAFDQGAQIEICDRGSRTALGKCRRTVKSHVAKFEHDYKDCVRVGAAVPTLHEATTGEQLPQFSQWLGQEDRTTKGWYAMLCDPTLPEAGDVADGAAMVGTE